MQQLPLFVNVDGRKVIVAGDGAAADAKRRLVKRAGGVCVDEDDVDARIAFVAVDNPGEAEALADQLRARGLLVNVVDRPELCDFTTPAIVDRSPVLIAISTGGVSAGMAKALRQRIEAMLPARLGALASAMASAREAIRTRWPDPTDRRAAIDCAFEDGGVLDPLADGGAVDVPLAEWLGDALPVSDESGSGDPDIDGVIGSEGVTVVVSLPMAGWLHDTRHGYMLPARMSPSRSMHCCVPGRR